MTSRTLNATYILHNTTPVLVWSHSHADDGTLDIVYDLKIRGLRGATPLGRTLTDRFRIGVHADMDGGKIYRVKELSEGLREKAMWSYLIQCLPEQALKIIIRKTFNYVYLLAARKHILQCPARVIQAEAVCC